MSLRKSDVLIGGGTWRETLFKQIDMVSKTDVSVLILGESGTGKELVARTIHSQSARNQAPFVTANCAAIPENLLEDELFGHVKGAFTGATSDRMGLIESASGGTLFLDEVGEIPLALQPKLLRVLQEREFRAVGDTVVRSANVRVVAATNRDLEDAVKAGLFREDLYYRLNVFPLELPPLRQRTGDLPLLVHHFLEKHSARIGKGAVSVDAQVIAALEKYSFPGNIRELENYLQRALVMLEGTRLTPETLPPLGNHSAAQSQFQVDFERTYRQQKLEMIADFDHKYVNQLLEHTHGNVSHAAKIAGMDRKNLWQLMKKSGVDPNDFR